MAQPEAWDVTGPNGTDVRVARQLGFGVGDAMVGAADPVPQATPAAATVSAPAASADIVSATEPEVLDASPSAAGGAGALEPAPAPAT